MVMELQPRSEHSQVTISDGQPLEVQKANSQDVIPNGTVDAGSPSTNLGEALAVPSTAVPSLQKWNSSKANMWRLFATFFSFVLIGANDAAYGVR